MSDLIELPCSEAYHMEEYDKYLHKAVPGGCTKLKVPNVAANLNMIWNTVAEEKKKWVKHGINHTEEEYRTVCSDFQNLINNKKGELRHANKIVREQLVKIHKLTEENNTLIGELAKSKDDFRTLKRTADKLPQYKEEFKTASKRLRKIEDYVTSYDFDYHHRDTVSAEEYFDTDPDLRLFFKIED